MCFQYEAVCGGDLDMETGQLESPNFPEDYQVSLVYTGIQCNGKHCFTLVYTGIHWYTMQWYTLAYTGIHWCLKVAPANFQFLWRALAFRYICFLFFSYISGVTTEDRIVQQQKNP